MNIETIYVIENSKFGEAIAAWAEGRRIQVVPTTKKNDALRETIDGVVLFHENHNFSKDDDETQNTLSEANISVHRVDINGTLAATKSSFNLWLDRNRPNSLLILGDDGVAENTNLPDFIKGIDS